MITELVYIPWSIGIMNIATHTKYNMKLTNQIEPAKHTLNKEARCRVEHVCVYCFPHCYAKGLAVRRPSVTSLSCDVINNIKSTHKTVGLQESSNGQP